MHNAILYTDTRAELITHALTLDAMQESVGGWICPAFTIPSPRGGSFAITGYVDDEGLLKELPLTALRVHPEGRDPLVGPLLVVGLDQSTGETVPLTDAEIRWFAMRMKVAVLQNNHEARQVWWFDFANFTVEGQPT